MANKLDELIERAEKVRMDMYQTRHAKYGDEYSGLLAAVKEQNDTIDALRSELDDAIGCLFDRGATEYVRLNYPEQYKRLQQETKS